MKRGTKLRGIERRLVLYPMLSDIETTEDGNHYPKDYKFVLNRRVRGEKLIIPATDQWLGRFVTQLDSVICYVPLKNGSITTYGVEMSRIWDEVEYHDGVPQLQLEIARAIHGVADSLWTNVSPADLMSRTIDAQAAERQAFDSLIEPYLQESPKRLRLV